MATCQACARSCSATACRASLESPYGAPCGEGNMPVQAVHALVQPVPARSLHMPFWDLALVAWGMMCALF